MSDEKTKKLDDEQLDEVDGGQMPTRGDATGPETFGPNAPQRPIGPDNAVD